MTSFPWFQHLNINTDPNWQVKTFTEIFLNMMSNLIPNETKRFVPRDPPWITKPLKTMLNRKNRLFKNYEKHRYKEEDKVRLEAFRIECQKAVESFDGHSVVPVPVDCDGRPGDFLKSTTYITDFLNAPLRDIRANKHKESMELFQFAATHVDRRKNELTFRKCQFRGKVLCENCQKKPSNGRKSFEKPPRDRWTDV